MLLSDRDRQLFSSENTENPDDDLITTRKYFWECPKGHQWEQTAYCRKKSKYGCPECVLSESPFLLKNSYPEIYASANPKNNPGIDISLVRSNARITLNFTCSEGHTHAKTVKSHVANPRCPQCNRHPFPKDLAKEWHPTKNQPLTCEMISAKSHRKVWWLCSNGHEWKTSPGSRLAGNHGCRLCRGGTCSENLPKKILDMWHPTKNNGHTPENTSYRSHKKIHFICDQGHEFIVTPKRLRDTNLDRICHQCQSLISKYPAVAALWDADKNDVTISSIRANSKRMCFWKCQANHRWQQTVANMTARKSLCHICHPPTTGFKDELPGYVYLVENTSKNWSKVGITNYPAKRIKEHIYQGFDKVVEVFYTEEGKLAKEAEASAIDSLNEKGFSASVAEPSDLRYGGHTEVFPSEALPHIKEWLENKNMIRVEWDFICQNR